MVFVTFHAVPLWVGVTFYLHCPLLVWLSRWNYARKKWLGCGIAFYNFSVDNLVSFPTWAITLPLSLATSARCLLLPRLTLFPFPVPFWFSIFRDSVPSSLSQVEIHPSLNTYTRKHPKLQFAPVTDVYLFVFPKVHGMSVCYGLETWIIIL